MYCCVSENKHYYYVRQRCVAKVLVLLGCSNGGRPVLAQSVIGDRPLYEESRCRGAWLRPSLSASTNDIHRRGRKIPDSEGDHQQTGGTSLIFLDDRVINFLFSSFYCLQYSVLLTVSIRHPSDIVIITEYCIPSDLILKSTASLQLKISAEVAHFISRNTMYIFRRRQCHQRGYHIQVSHTMWTQNGITVLYWNG